MNQGVKELIEISRAYGSKKEYVIAGGGNTSFKTENQLWIKASGFALATISEEGFGVMDRSKLDKISENEYSSDSFERESQIKDDLAAATITKDKRPSVETSFHNAINYKFVIHLHPTAVNGIMCSNKAEELVKPVFGDEAVYIPYIDPGYILFKAVEAKILAFRAEKGYDPKVILLQNHGIFVSADTTQEVIDIYDEIIANIEKAVATPVDETVLPVAEHVTAVVPAIRAIVSQDGLKTIKVTNSALVEKFNASAEAFEKVNYPFTPDLIVYCKSKYIYVDEVASPESTIEAFKTKYEAFVADYGFAPKVVFIKGIGMLSIGDNAAQSNIIKEVFEDAMKISWLSESFGGQHFMTPEQINFIDTWEVENYRRKVSAGASAGRVENKISIVTGAAQGFGEGIARVMKENGSNIVVADLNETVGKTTANSFNAIKNSSRAIFVQTNVADQDSLKNLMHQTVCEFGGLDVFVSNAGILRAGGLEEMTPENFDLVTKINYNAYFYCTKAATPIMKLQNKYNAKLYADVIQINSKSGLAGSKKNFAYAGGKFGGIGLTQSFALELAPDRIKVNSICPGNFYEGPLWSDPENGLFVQYLNAGKVPGAKTIDDVKAFYLAQVPLGKGCSPVDVAKAVFYAIDQENETGQAIPVSGGQIMLN
ncbi:SDR family NAD(P)-dependent oxidoreductase [Maribellus sediminis]|uniref:SDR family NAD(P)-dependent oxidoreductase n=1 Tax=Maribellus sediminis TaxID=2696285 RepID=UPI001430DBC8|nr:SDR family NAD(P)-dependent oxidoreductase [Maribellus sediminis]